MIPLTKAIIVAQSNGGVWDGFRAGNITPSVLTNLSKCVYDPSKNYVLYAVPLSLRAGQAPVLNSDLFEWGDYRLQITPGMEVGFTFETALSHPFPGVFGWTVATSLDRESSSTASSALVTAMYRRFDFSSNAASTDWLVDGIGYVLVGFPSF